MALPTVTGTWRCGTEPKLRFAPSGIAVCNFRAVASAAKKVGDDWETTGEIWVSAVAFGRLAEFVAENVEKGQQINMFGTIETQTWTDKEGEERKDTQVVVRGIDPIPKRDDESRSQRRIEPDPPPVRQDDTDPPF